ncbi:WNK lysine deficient protein kinase [Enteropsectra breve]|nr:WNK lysine deficient protein kinase [Enteropsectra breve]
MAHTRYRKLGEILGEGSYKTVSKAIDEEEGKEVAYNEVRVKKYEEEVHSSSSFSSEIALLKNINHPNIIKIIDYWFTEEDFVFITELMTGGTLRDYIRKVGALNDKLIRKWGRQILEGIKYLHTQDPPIIHRDIKNENIFVNSSQGEIKIGDLGIAKEKKNKRYTIVGTPNFMAREIFEGEGYTEKVDVYAFGMCLIEMATGVSPYGELSNSGEIYKNVLQGVLPHALHTLQSNCLKSLILSCLLPVPNRFSAAQCLEHHYFTQTPACDGTCIPRECATVLPISSSDAEMKLSLIAFTDPVIVFQIFLVESSRFIKFDYDLNEDTVQKVSTELIKEKIIKSEFIEAFSELLKKGVEKALEMKNAGHLKDGIVNLERNSCGHFIDGIKLKSTPCKHGSSDRNDRPHSETDARSTSKSEFGEKTIEAMQEIEKEMQIVEKIKSIVIEPSIKKNEQHPCDTGDAAFSSNGSPEILPMDKSTAPSLCDARSSGLRKSQQQEGAPSDGGMRSDGVKADGIIAASLIVTPPMKSPPMPTGRLTEEQIVSDLSLSESYDISKQKYKANAPVVQFAFDAAGITGRTEDTARSWIKVLRDEDLESVSDLKLLVYEDWEKLPLTVFASRAMQNMLYGIDNVPLKEKQLVVNLSLQEYDNKTPVQEFVSDVCMCIRRPELAHTWENKLLEQDIRTVAELKSLHQDDWARLGLTVFGYRILKNIIYKKGKISTEYAA